jgi:hypothetical protein
LPWSSTRGCSTARPTAWPPAGSGPAGPEPAGEVGQSVQLEADPADPGPPSLPSFVYRPSPGGSHGHPTRGCIPGPAVVCPGRRAWETRAHKGGAAIRRACADRAPLSPSRTKVRNRRTVFSSDLRILSMIIGLARSVCGPAVRSTRVVASGNRSVAPGSVVRRRRSPSRGESPRVRCRTRPPAPQPQP